MALHIDSATTTKIWACFVTLTYPTLARSAHLWPKPRTTPRRLFTLRHRLPKRHSSARSTIPPPFRPSVIRRVRGMRVIVVSFLWDAGRNAVMKWGKGRCIRAKTSSFPFPIQSDEHFYTVASLFLPVGVVRRRTAGVSRRVTWRLVATHQWTNAHRSPAIFNRSLYMVVRDVERNAMRANLVESAELWRWSSFWRRVYRPKGSKEAKSILSAWPLPELSNWLEWV